MGETGFTSTFVDGARDLLGVALIIGIARGITVVMNNGQITDTVFTGRSRRWRTGRGRLRQRDVRAVPAAVVPDPVLVRARDGGDADHGAAGRLRRRPDRSLVVTAYQSATGLLNLVTPTSAVVMGGLAIARSDTGSSSGSCGRCSAMLAALTSWSSSVGALVACSRGRTGGTTHDGRNIDHGVGRRARPEAGRAPGGVHRRRGHGRRRDLRAPRGGGRGRRGRGLDVVPLAGVIAALQGYSFAKFGARYPSAGGLLEYVSRGFGDGHIATRHRRGWSSRPTSSSPAWSRVSFGSYASGAVADGDTGWVKASRCSWWRMTAPQRRWARTFVARVQTVVVFVVDRHPRRVRGVDARQHRPGPPRPVGVPGGPRHRVGVALTFFAFLGFGVVTFTAKDLADPARQLPRAMALAHRHRDRRSTSLWHSAYSARSRCTRSWPPGRTAIAVAASRCSARRATG